MGNNTPKKITTDCSYICITKDEIGLGVYNKVYLQWNSEEIGAEHIIQTDKISEYSINFTNEKLEFDIDFLNLEICKWIHEILSNRHLHVEFTLRRPNIQPMMNRYLVDNPFIYNSSYLIFRTTCKLPQESYNFYDSVFRYAAKSFHIKNILFSVQLDFGIFHDITYDENTIELDD